MLSFAKIQDRFAEREMWDDELTTLYEDAEPKQTFENS